MRLRHLVLTELESLPAPSSGRVLIQTLREITVRSSDGTQDYLVRVTAGGRLVCSCRGYVYRQTCRHVREARGVLEESRA